MLSITTQEILGAASIPASKSEIIAYILTKKALVEEDEAEEGVIIPADEISLLLGNYFPTKECNRTVSKFKPFIEIPCYSLEDAKALWQGRVRNKKEK